MNSAESKEGYDEMGRRKLGDVIAAVVLKKDGAYIAVDIVDHTDDGGLIF